MIGELWYSLRCTAFTMAGGGFSVVEGVFYSIPVTRATIVAF